MRLLGRAEEIQTLRRLVEAARGGSSGVLVVRGEPGIGKSVLLQSAMTAAVGMRRIVVTGVEAERELGYAALHRLLGPFLGRRQELPAPQRDALGVAFGLVHGRPADPFVVCLAVLTLLAPAAGEQPLLCVCDDAQWIDRESLQALAFLARRLDADPVALLFGVRDPESGPSPVPALDDLPTQRLGGLPDALARTLAVESAHGRFDERELDRVVAETGGNPLAIRELAADWAHGRGRPGAGVPLADRLPLGTVLEARFRDRVRALAEPAQTLLLVVAAEPTGDPDLVWRALTGLDAVGAAEDIGAAAAPARAAGLLTDAPTLSFCHPLMRSAVYGGADEDARRRVHGALAAAIPAGVDADRRSWHLAAAGTGPDEDVAAELESAARRARERAGYSAEAAFLAAAAERTADVDRAAGRLFEAGVAAVRAGLPARAAELLARVSPDADAGLRSAVALTRGAAWIQLDRFAEGGLAMVRAATELSTVLPPPRAREALLEVLQTHAMATWTDPAGTTAMLRAAAGLIADLPAPPTPSDLLLDAHTTHLLGSPEQGMTALRGVLGLLDSDQALDVAARWGPLLVVAPRELLDDDAMVAGAQKIVDLARANGATTGLRVALVGRALTETFVGRLDAAELDHAEVAEVAAVQGGTSFLRRPHDALLRAWRGDPAGVARAGAALPAAPGEPWVGASPVQLVRTAEAVLALAAGRYADALAAAGRVYADDPPYWGHLALPDLVEAGVRTGDRIAAEAAERRFAERATAAGTPWALGLLARNRALLAEGAAAEARYREAVDRLSGSRIVPERARAHLLYGEWLRRRRRRTDARAELGQAHEMFTAMGAVGFAERARTELVAAGAAVRRARGTSAALTAQEGRIARLAAAGATNQQIATELYLSVNTVEYHLRKVFGKTGVRSRRELGAVPLGE